MKRTLTLATISFLWIPMLVAGDVSSTSDEMTRGFGASSGITEIEKQSSEDDKFKIGGTLWTELDYYRLSGKEVFSNPNNLWLYGDVRLRNDIRAYIKGRLIYDPTVSGTAVSPIAGVAFKEYQSALSEMKLMFKVEKLLFFTLGRQKLKWGTGKFWNPSDFLNSQKREMFRTEDRRAGLTLLKTHLPIGKWNFYLIQDLQGAETPSNIGHAARIEAAFSASEFGISAFSKPGQKAMVGIDGSFAFFDLDLYFEGAYSKGSNQTLYRSADATGSSYVPYRDDTTGFTRAVVGAAYDYKYSDKDTISLGLEYFYNGEGYTDSKAFPWVLIGGVYTPFYLSRHYGALFVMVPTPGSLREFTFSLYNLLSITDHSAVSRLNVDIKIMQDLACNLGLGVHYGNDTGEFRLGGQSLDVVGGLRVDF